MAVSILAGEGVRVESHAPAALLRAHVASYWELHVATPPAAIRLIPDGLIDLTFDLVRRQAFVTGPLHEAASHTHETEVTLLGASLRPGTAVALLGTSASSLPNEWQPLSRVLGPVADELATLVFDAQDLRARLALLDAFFLARVFATASNARVVAAVRAIEASDGAVDVDALAAMSGASARNLGRLFDEWVGMPPKRFARIVRLQAVMRRLSQDPSIDLAALAFETGFSDQAHLTRELQALGGLTPRTLSDSFKK